MNPWQSLAKKLVAAGLPAIGSAFAGPAGAAVATRVAAELGIADADPAVIEQAIDADPETMVRLREIDAQIERDAQAHVERMMAATEENIREARKLPDLNPIRVWILAFTLLALFFLGAGLVVSALEIEMQEGLMGVFIAILGMLSTKLGTAYDYFFGSSVGSANKELMIDEARRRLLDGARGAAP